MQESELPECGVRLEECKELKVLGTGSFGKTVLLERQGREYVAKHLRFARGRISHDQTILFAATVDSLKDFTHPCVLRFIGSSQTGPDSAMILMPYMPCGSLDAAMNQEQRPEWWTPTTVAIILVCIILAMVEAHHHDMRHGSLKPSNILLDGEHLARISDFGGPEWQSAGVARELGTEATLYVDQRIPVDTDDDPKGFAGDVYSFGIIFYEMLMLGKGQSDVIRRIALNRILSGARPEFPTDFPEWVRNVIDDCWATNPEQRPTFRHVFQIFQRQKFAVTMGVKTAEVQNIVTRIGWTADVPQHAGSAPADLRVAPVTKG
jgi:serine/threonine protein kinase